MNRRDFCKLSTITATGTVALSGCAPQLRKIESRVNAPAGYPVDAELWYYSACPGCGSACGTMVRVIDGRAKKLEGNPQHPVNTGRLCARGQTGLQLLYHPDRVNGPQKRSGDRGANSFQKADSWDNAIAEAARRLNEAAGRGDNSVLFFTGAIDGHTGLVVDRFAKALRGPGRLTLEALPYTALRQANKLTYGTDQLAEYDIDHADYVLSFGSNMLESGPSVVRYARGYGNLRQGRPDIRGRLVHLEPRLSLTAANADTWIPIKPGTEGAFALGVLNAIVNGNRPLPQGGPNAQNWKGALGNFAPDKVSQITGVPTETIQQVAKDFAAARAPIAIPGFVPAGHTNAVPALMAINALNVLMNNGGKEGGVRFAPRLPFKDPLLATPISYNDLLGHVNRMRNGQVGAAIFYDINPVYTLPEAVGFVDALAKVPFVLSLSSFLDETTQYADMVLPDTSFLERWDTRVNANAVSQAVLTVQQPVVNPYVDARSAPDTLIAIAKAMGGSAASALPYNSFVDVLQEAAGQIQQANSGSVRGGSVGEVFTALLSKGGWWSDPSTQVPNVDQGAVQGNLKYEDPRFDGDASTYPFYLQVYEPTALGEGRYAIVPWMQELPDPMTTVVWGSWVEMNPVTVQKMGLSEGDLVEIESPRGKVRAPIYAYPGIAPDVIAIPLGQGHTAYGRKPVEQNQIIEQTINHRGRNPQWILETSRGANPMSILAPTLDSQAGALAYQATRVKVTKTGVAARMVTIEGLSKKLPGKAFFEP
ncbi:MAG: molybdopterin-containing oxidoreductase family protein [Chloroflexota bacterium]